jgi:micrococcal nuclease
LKKTVVAVGGAAVIAGTGFWAVKAGKIAFPLPYYSAARVIDGDTFVTKENQYIRLSSTYAPELGLCGSEEAKTELGKLVMGKKIFIKVVFRDQYQRLVSYVYTPEGNVNSKMLEGGFAYFWNKGNEDDAGLAKISNIAKDHKLGIFSEKCTQSVNKGNPKCIIKGNNVRGDKKYHYPGCGLYNSTIVQLYLGDSWFCSEKEAIKAGFEKGGDCGN